MLDERGLQTARNIHDQFIQPEIERRREVGALSDDFRIRECLIRLLKGQAPIVDFNNEVKWRAEPKLAPGLDLQQFEFGRVVHLHEVVAFNRVYPPEVDQRRVAFIFLFWTGTEYAAVFDFSPNLPDFDPDSEFDLGQVIADHLNNKIVEITVSLSKSNQKQLQQIGLWPVTSLLPYPISLIIERIGSGRLEEARQILIDHCNIRFINELVETWQPIQAFERRIALFREAAAVHANRQHYAAIYTLIPQIEGVISDWLLSVLGPNEMPHRAESKIRQFQVLIKNTPQFSVAYREALEAVCQFLLQGPPLQSFKQWLDEIDPSFPGRHSVLHGRYEDQVFTEENSIKLFLMLDTLCQFMMFYEARNEKQRTEPPDGASSNQSN